METPGWPKTFQIILCKRISLLVTCDQEQTLDLDLNLFLVSVVRLS